MDSFLRRAVECNCVYVVFFYSFSSFISYFFGFCAQSFYRTKSEAHGQRQHQQQYIDDDDVDDTITIKPNRMKRVIRFHLPCYPMKCDSARKLYIYIYFSLWNNFSLTSSPSSSIHLEIRTQSCVLGRHALPYIHCTLYHYYYCIDNANSK